MNKQKKDKFIIARVTEDVFMKFKKKLGEKKASDKLREMVESFIK